VLTYRRNAGLARLLGGLVAQVDAPRFEVVVVDNDPQGGARVVVDGFRDRLVLRYHVDPVRCLARLRNRSVMAARGMFLGFVDDDEEVPPTWLAAHHALLERTGADVSSGAVEHRFDPQVPAVIRACKMFQRPAAFTAGHPLPWFWAFTGNAYVRRSALPHATMPFEPHFGRTGGEDVDCFRRMVEAGRRLVYSGPETCVVEERGLARANRDWVRRRAIRNGGNLADIQWGHEPGWRRVVFAAKCLRQGLAQGWRARHLDAADPVEAMNQRIEGWMNIGRCLAVFQFRHAEYGARG
jgi:succinoglycan biosynthesis protein ExoM